MDDVLIVSGARTPIGSFGKAFVDVQAADLGIAAARCAVERAQVDADQVDEVILGCVGQFGGDAYIARAVGLGAGLPIETSAATINRLCGSGLQAINTAAQVIWSGDADVILAGGAENMSRYPYLSFSNRWGARMGDTHQMDGLRLLLSDPFTDCHMGVTAERVSQRWQVDREAQDQFAFGSQRKAAAAISTGRFKDEIVPVAVPGKGGQTILVDTDEHPRPGTSLEDLAHLKPAFEENGTVTAGNASGLNDGAAAVMVMSARSAQRMDVKPLVRLVAHAVAGVDPEVMGIGPVPAVRKVLRKAALSIDDIDLVELNEAFAAQSLACMRDLALDPEKVNVNGGAIALGHPLGATGAALTVKLMYEMKRRQVRYGMVAMCIGGGQGIASVFERVA